MKFDFRSERENSVQFFFFAIWSLNVLKRIRKIFPLKAFEQRNKETWIKFNPRVALISLRNNGPKNSIWTDKLALFFAVNYSISVGDHSTVTESVSWSVSGSFSEYHTTEGINVTAIMSHVMSNSVPVSSSPMLPPHCYRVCYCNKSVGE